uniref:Putative cytochrome n=1 Tax=Corethrella appendiculata TaxID=1370023 RepID=U5EW43_9DIPT
MICIFLLTILSALIAFYVYLIWDFNYWKKRGIPGPTPRAFFGNLPSMFTQKKHIALEMDKIYKEFADQPLVGIFSIRTPQLMVKDPELIQEVTVKNFKSFHDNEFSQLVDKKSDPLFGRNPFMLTGEEWKERRNEITPAFSPARIKVLQPLIDEVAGRLTNYIKDQHEALDTKELASKYTTDVVSSCIFATDAQSFKTEKPMIREAGRKLVEFTFTTYIILFLVSLFPFVKKFKKFQFVAREVEIFFTKIMVDAIKYRKDNNVVRADYLDHLMQMQEKKQLTDLELAAHGVSFFADGFETSSIVISHCLYDIAANPNVQQKLRAEIQNVITKKGGLTYDNIAEMEYLDQVLNESLRCHSIASHLSRLCTEKTELTGLKDKKYTIEAGTLIIIPFYSVFLDAKYYENPEKFDPERFNAENGGVKAYQDKNVFFPFGNGPRKCLGMRFALAQIKRCIVEVVKNFEISVDKKTKEPLHPDPKQFMIVPIGGVWLNFKSIEK